MKPDAKPDSPGSMIPDMRNYEKLSDRLDNKMLDFSLKMLGFIAAMLLRPLAICTQVVFRKNFGERYFNETPMIFSLLLFGAAEIFSKPVMLIRDELLRAYNWGWLASWLDETVHPHLAAGILTLAFYLCASLNLKIIRGRQASGVPWYSMSRGESIFGSESPAREAIVSLLVGGSLLLAAPAFGLLFFASRAAAYYLFIKEQQSNYARYLDYMDAQILAGKIEPAMIGNQSPRQTDGLYCPLPNRFKGEHRAYVAKISASVLSRTAATRTDSAEGQASESRSSAPNFDPWKTFDPNAAMANLSKEQHLWWGGIGVFIRKCFIVLLILVPIATVVFVVVQLTRSHPANPPAVVAKAVPQPAEPQRLEPAPPSQPPPKQPVQLLQHAATTQEKAISAMMDDTPPAANPVKPETSIIATAPSARPTAPLNPIVNPKPEHQNGVAAEFDAFNQFESYSHAKYKVERARIEQLHNGPSKSELRKALDDLGNSLQETEDSQRNYLKDLHVGVPADEAAVRSLPPMLASRQSTTNALLRLEKQIDAAANQ